MGKEIERKFLVTGRGWRKHADRGKKIRQAYLAHTRETTIRVRTIGKDKAFLTIKSAKAELSRHEYEYEIPVADARKLMNGSAASSSSGATSSRSIVRASRSTCSDAS